MKRTAAVLGPTPPFLRWAIGQACPLRDVDVDNLADQTFRQLRNLRELSNGYRQHRVMDGICVHPAPMGDADLLRGFHVDEVFDYFGDAQSLQATCGKCPANCSAAVETDWAGCFGLVPVDLNFTFGHTPASQVLPHDSLAEIVDPILGQPLGFYRLWIDRWVDPQGLAKLADVFHQAASQRPNHDALQQFANACRRCADHRLGLFVELVPAGFSDGVHWRLSRGCIRCRYHGQQPREKGTPCPVCGNGHADDSGRKAKVLGLRPYLLLQRVIGKLPTQEFVRRYRQHRQNLEEPLETKQRPSGNSDTRFSD